jgi:hypothetical protein
MKQHAVYIASFHGHVATVAFLLKNGVGHIDVALEWAVQGPREKVVRI